MNAVIVYKTRLKNIILPSKKKEKSYFLGQQFSAFLLIAAFSNCCLCISEFSTNMEFCSRLQIFSIGHPIFVSFSSIFRTCDNVQRFFRKCRRFCRTLAFENDFPCQYSFLAIIFSTVERF